MREVRRALPCSISAINIALLVAVHSTKVGVRGGFGRFGHESLLRQSKLANCRTVASPVKAEIFAL
jgi:hypothetical protein